MKQLKEENARLRPVVVNHGLTSQELQTVCEAVSFERDSTTGIDDLIDAYQVRARLVDSSNLANQPAYRFGRLRIISYFIEPRSVVARRANTSSQPSRPDRSRTTCKRASSGDSTLYSQRVADDCVLVRPSNCAPSRATSRQITIRRSPRVTAAGAADVDGGGVLGRGSTTVGALITGGLGTDGVTSPRAWHFRHLADRPT